MRNNLDILLSDGIIDEVLGLLQSGKEAEVYRVSYRGQIVAAKVYKDRQQRSFKHNAAYKEGRKVRNSRTQRAMDKGSRFGRDEAEDAWKSSEATTLHLLHGHGVRVPTPVMFYEGVLLMQLVTDGDGDAAPRLVDAPIAREHAAALYRDLRSQIIGVLCCDLIHGDLSPYNVLLGADGPTIIDFPQTISAAHNTQSEMFFRRDLDNILSFFAGLDRSLNAHRGDARAIWQAYARRELGPDFVPPARQHEEERRPGPPRGSGGPGGPRGQQEGWAARQPGAAHQGQGRQGQGPPAHQGQGHQAHHAQGHEGQGPQPQGQQAYQGQGQHPQAQQGRHAQGQGYAQPAQHAQDQGRHVQGQGYAQPAQHGQDQGRHVQGQGYAQPAQHAQDQGRHVQGQGHAQPAQHGQPQGRHAHGQQGQGRGFAPREPGHPQEQRRDRQPPARPPQQAGRSPIEVYVKRTGTRESSSRVEVMQGRPQQAPQAPQGQQSARPQAPRVEGEGRPGRRGRRG